MRRLLLATSFAALLLSFALAALWLRSHFRHDRLSRGTATGDWSLASHRGSLHFETSRWFGDDPPPPALTLATSSVNTHASPFPPRRLLHRQTTAEAPFLDHPPAVRSTFHLLGMSWSHYDTPPAGGYTHHPFTLSVPFAHLAFLTALLAIPFLRRAYLTLQRRHAPSRCPTCLYDLRAHPAAGKCPECGTPIRLALYQKGLPPLPPRPQQ